MNSSLKSEKENLILPFSHALHSVENGEIFKQGIDELITIKNKLPSYYGEEVHLIFKKIISDLIYFKKKNKKIELAKYVEEKIHSNS